MGRVNVDMSINTLIDDFNSDNSENVIDIENIEVIDSDNGKWQPKKWKPEYEYIVMLDLAGLKGYEIAEKTGYTKQHIYNILGTDEAQAIQRSLVHRTRKEGVDIAKKINRIQELTVTRLEKCLEDDDLFKESRLGFITKGIDVMKGTGEHLKNAPTNQVTNNFQLPPSVMDKFLVGLEKSDEARRLLLEKNNIDEVEVIE